MAFGGRHPRHPRACRKDRAFSCRALSTPQALRSGLALIFEQARDDAAGTQDKAVFETAIIFNGR